MAKSKAVAIIADFSRRLGVYHQVREIYDKLRPTARDQRRIDRALYKKLVSPRQLVFDIGANKGQKTAVFHALGAHVVAVEPNPRAAEIIRCSYRGKTGVEVVEAAVGQEKGNATLHFRFTDTRASLRADWHHFNYSNSETAQVDVVTLDMLIGRFGKPDFCKIDVEGYEVNVIRGLSSPIPCLSLEFHDDERDRFLDCLAHLETLGPIETNAIEMNGSEFLFDGWQSPDALRGWLKDGEFPQGDMFLRMPST